MCKCKSAIYKEQVTASAYEIDTHIFNLLVRSVFKKHGTLVASGKYEGETKVWLKEVNQWFGNRFSMRKTDTKKYLKHLGARGYPIQVEPSGNIYLTEGGELREF
tara:strand:- start:233 stop:547 length:315 start_codon:yes stop_codon:yes gene_type:complete